MQSLPPDILRQIALSIPRDKVLALCHANQYLRSAIYDSLTFWRQAALQDLLSSEERLNNIPLEKLRKHVLYFATRPCICSNYDETIVSVEDIACYGYDRFLDRSMKCPNVLWDGLLFRIAMKGYIDLINKYLHVYSDDRGFCVVAQGLAKGGHVSLLSSFIPRLNPTDLQYTLAQAIYYSRVVSVDCVNTILNSGRIPRSALMNILCSVTQTRPLEPEIQEILWNHLDDNQKRIYNENANFRGLPQM